MRFSGGVLKDARWAVLRAAAVLLAAEILRDGMRFPRTLRTMVGFIPGLVAVLFAPHLTVFAAALGALSLRAAMQSGSPVRRLLDAAAAALALRTALLAGLSSHRTLHGREAFRKAASDLPPAPTKPPQPPQPPPPEQRAGQQGQQGQLGHIFAITPTVPQEPDAPDPPATDGAARSIGGVGAGRALRSAMALPITQWGGLSITRGVVYSEAAPGLRLDVYRRKGLEGPAPTLLYFHGGGWIAGDKALHSLPLLLGIATRGWLVLAANYRLSTVPMRPGGRPGGATFPDHLHDCLRAVAWARGPDARSYGGGGGTLVVAGESAGGHLSCLVGLTHRVPRMLPPEMPAADLRVDGVVDLYGVHDPGDTRGHFAAMRGGSGFRQFFRTTVLKTPKTDAAAWEAVSPLWWVEHGLADGAQPTPPFLVVHGTHDSLVPVGDARSFVDALRAKRAQWGDGKQTVRDVYVEVPGALHAFNFVHSPLTYALSDTVVRFISAVDKSARAGRAASGAAAASRL
eukprot:TRINITY_DN10690_c0_g1_i1.p1 TRINITY_DN10690_c0_g1~~TRINITY_DN10690_c0_g1_i1.p1  ORF type:complete len:540 (+),score=124.96 TRINITY_DN10690_c0_g1_i1:81-1622(+)